MKHTLAVIEELIVDFPVAVRVTEGTLKIDRNLPTMAILMFLKQESLSLADLGKFTLSLLKWHLAAKL